MKAVTVKKLRRVARRADVELWSLDECHFQQHGSLAYAGSPGNLGLHLAPCADPQVRGVLRRRQLEHRSAACPIFNAATFQRFLRRLLRQQTPGRRMIVVLDSARYHHALLLAPFQRRHVQHLRLLFLPPYSPQLATIV